MFQLLIPFVLISVCLPCSFQRSRYEESASQQLAKIEDDFWEWRMEDAPMFSTLAGETRYNDILESFAYSVYEKRKTKVTEFLRRVQKLDTSQLNEDQQFDRDIFEDHLNTYLEGAKWNEYFAVNPVNFLEGVNADPSRMESFMPSNTTTDFENYLKRIGNLSQQIDEQIELLRIAISLGHTLHNRSVADVPDQIDGLVQLSPQESPFYQPVFTTELNSSEVHEALRASLRERAVNAVNNISEALKRMKAFLVQDYFPATRSTYGVSGWPDGKEIYQQCLKYHTSTNMTPEEVHNLGLKEVARINENMKAALKRLNFSGSVKEFFDSIRINPLFKLNTSQEYLDTYKKYIYELINPKIQQKQVFNDIPNLPLSVRPMPYDGPGAVYIPGTPDGSVPGIFSINVMHPELMTTIAIMSLSLHEAIPGHHLQNIFSLVAPIPKYRAIIEDDHYYRMPCSFKINTDFLEGWGLYSEYLGEELGLYTDDYMLMGRYSDEIFRACRMVVDTGLHHYGWSRDQAIDYMYNYTAESRSGVEIEIDRYMTWPGQATAYKIGEIKIKELRQKAESELGDRFKLADFHSVMLKNGGMPLNLLERLINQWIDKVSSSGSQSSSSAVIEENMDEQIHNSSRKSILIKQDTIAQDWHFRCLGFGCAWQFPSHYNPPGKEESTAH